MEFNNNNGLAAAPIKARVVITGPVFDLEPFPFGCMACTSGDSPIWDIEQSFLFGR